MSHIGLLMTGVLTTGQPSGSKLPKQPVQPNNGVQQSTRDRLTENLIATEITPPEFIHSGESQFTDLAINSKQQNILNEFTEKISSEESRLSEIGKDTVLGAFYTLIQQEPSVTGFSDEQSFDKLITKRSPKPKQKLNLMSQNLPTLSFGSSGVSVKVLQRVLLSNGYGVRVDGVFGALTESAVKAFQNRRNLLADGVVGPKTWRKLSE